MKWTCESQVYTNLYLVHMAPKNNNTDIHSCGLYNKVLLGYFALRDTLWRPLDTRKKKNWMYIPDYRDSSIRNEYFIVILRIELHWTELFLIETSIKIYTLLIMQLILGKSLANEAYREEFKSKLEEKRFPREYATSQV